MLTLALIALLLPAACFVLLAVVWPLRHQGRLAGVLSSSVAVATLVASVLALLNYEDPVDATLPWLVSRGHTIAEVGIHLDGISLSMMAVVALVASCVQIYSLGYLDDQDGPSLGRYFAWHSLFIFAMQTLVLAPNLLQLFAGWELVGLCSYLLIGFFWREGHAGKAAVKAFWVNKFADMGLMSAVILMYVATGQFGWDKALPPGTAELIAGLLLVGVMGKSAQFPLHTWLPDAMAGPTPVSALLHAATMVAAGVFLVVRAYPIFAAAPHVLVFMTWLGAGTALMAAVIAVFQDDIKKVLAYSTASQLGYMVAALGSGEAMGGYYHLTTHAFFKALLFLAAGAAIHTVHSNDIHDMGGLLKRTPVSGGLFLIGTAALIGLPPFAGFFSKDLLLEELYEAGAWGPLVMLILGVALTAFYMTRVVSVAYLGPPKGKSAAHAGQPEHEAPATMLGPMLLLGFFALGAGGLAGPLAARWGMHYAFHLSPVGVVALVFALSGMALAWLQYGLGRQLLPLGGGLRSLVLSAPVDRAWEAAWRSATLPLARGIGWFDRYIVDGLINLVGWGTLKGAALARKAQTGRSRDYLFAVILGVIVYAAYGVIGARP